MKTDLGKRLFSIIKSKHTSFDSDRVKSEILFMEECDVSGDVLSLYNKVSFSPSLCGHSNVLNSLVCYLLGITDCEPSGKFSLKKRRTYGRSGFPDVDMDFNHYRRSEISEYLFKKYGREYVSNIGTVQRLTTKNCLHKTIMVLDPDHNVIFDNTGKKIRDGKSETFELRKRIVNTIPTIMKRANGSKVKTVEEAYNEYTEFKEYMNNYQDVYRTAKNMEGSISAFGCLAKDTAILTAQGYVRIDQLDSKDSVAYLNGDKQVRYTTDYFACCTGRKICYKIKLVNGCWIKVTDEHLIFTDKGCVLFEEIRKKPDQYKILSIKT